MITLYGHTDFELFGEVLSREELRSLLYNASMVLTARQDALAASLLEKYPFVLHDATNHFADDFTALLAEVDLKPYEELRAFSGEEEGKYAFSRIAEVISELGPYVRVIACALRRAVPDGAWQEGATAPPTDAVMVQDQPQPSLEDLVRDIVAQRDLMIDVATGGTRIAEVAQVYEERRLRIVGRLESMGIADPNQFTTLWMWYERWKASDLPSYQSRRAFVADLYSSLLEQLRKAEIVPILLPPTGWKRVDRVLYGAKRGLLNANTEEEYQGLGLLCREVMISLAQAVYDPAAHDARDGVTPSATDAYRMLEGYIDATLPGKANEATRRFVKASLALANELQHDRRATYRNAALCVDATGNLVNAVATISGRRDRP